MHYYFLLPLFFSILHIWYSKGNLRKFKEIGLFVLGILHNRVSANEWCVLGSYSNVSDEQAGHDGERRNN